MSLGLPAISMGGLGSGAGAALGAGGGAGGLSFLSMLGGPWGAALAAAPMLFSLFGGDPQRRMRHEMMKMFTPENINAWSRTNLRQLGSDPNTMMARGQIMQSGNALQNDLAKSFGARGLGTTGIAAAALPIARSATGARLGQFEGQLQGQARQMALAQLQAQAQALMGNPYGQSRFQGGMDRSFGAMLPLLQMYMMKRMGIPMQGGYGG